MIPAMTKLNNIMMRTALCGDLERSRISVAHSIRRDSSRMRPSPTRRFCAAFQSGS